MPSSEFGRQVITDETFSSSICYWLYIYESRFLSVKGSSIYDVPKKSGFWLNPLSSSLFSLPMLSSEFGRQVSTLQMKHFHHLSVIGYIFMNPVFSLLNSFMMSQKIRFLTPPLPLSTCVHMGRTRSPLVDVHTRST